jgi:hypothetical protein
MVLIPVQDREATANSTTGLRNSFGARAPRCTSVHNATDHCPVRMGKIIALLPRCASRSIVGAQDGAAADCVPLFIVSIEVTGRKDRRVF